MQNLFKLGKLLLLVIFVCLNFLLLIINVLKTLIIMDLSDVWRCKRILLLKGLNSS